MNRDKLSNTWRPRAASTAISVDFDDEHEISIYCERTERIHCLNESASVVWALCDGKRDVADVVREVAKVAQTDAEAVRSDVERCLASLRGLGVLR